jgi:phage terminase large subunit-like protein
VRYDEWKAKGYLEITEGRVIDYSFVRLKIMQLSETYRIKEIAFDRYGARLMAEQLENARLKATDFGQGFIGMSGATKEMHRLVLQERIAHGGNPILRWNFDNMVVKIDEAGNIKPDKKQATAKIDGAVAAIMAVEFANRPKKRSAYADRGIIAYGEDGFLTL